MLRGLSKRLFRRSARPPARKGKGGKAQATAPAKPPPSEPDGGSDHVALADLEDQMVAVRKDDTLSDEAPDPAGPIAGRKALIDQALAVHRSRQNLLDDLDDDQRAKLKYLADTLLADKTRDPS